MRGDAAVPDRMLLDGVSRAGDWRVAVCRIATIVKPFLLYNAEIPDGHDCRGHRAALPATATPVRHCCRNGTPVRN